MSRRLSDLEPLRRLLDVVETTQGSRLETRLCRRCCGTYRQMPVGCLRDSWRDRCEMCGTGHVGEFKNLLSFFVGPGAAGLKARCLWPDKKSKSLTKSGGFAPRPLPRPLPGIFGRCLGMFCGCPAMSWDLRMMSRMSTGMSGMYGDVPGWTCASIPDDAVLTKVRSAACMFSPGRVPQVCRRRPCPCPCPLHRSPPIYGLGVIHPCRLGGGGP